jgi:hypothetical protein
MHRRFVFHVRGHVLRDLVRFESVYLTALVINAVALPLLVKLGLARIPAQAIVMVSTMLLSYFRPPTLLFTARRRRHSGRDVTQIRGDHARGTTFRPKPYCRIVFDYYASRCGENSVIGSDVDSDADEVITAVCEGSFKAGSSPLLRGVGRSPSNRVRSSDKHSRVPTAKNEPIPSASKAGPNMSTK